MRYPRVITPFFRSNSSLFGNQAGSAVATIGCLGWLTLLATTALTSACTIKSEDSGDTAASDLAGDAAVEGVFEWDSLFFQDTLPKEDQRPEEFVTLLDGNSDSDGVATSCGGKACVGSPCIDNDDCESALCVFHLGDKLCTGTCIEECPQGFQCSPLDVGVDSIFACISNHSHLCLPCTSDDDCSGGGFKNRCLPYGETGNFCGSSCLDQSSCPAGYKCQQAKGLDGSLSNQCIFEQGECPCSTTAKALALSTTCSSTNTFGHCKGQRICGESGLGPCTAQVPEAESCDGEDNDCDGAVDEETCFDGNPCTADQCVPGTGCLFTNLVETACNDSDACTYGDMCVEGSCVGTPLACSDGNPCTTDACDPIAGCIYPDNEEPCTDQDPCTFGDTCFQGQCHSGTVSNCDDDNPCTDDYCHETEQCVHIPNAAECTDNNACTIGDHCENGWCIPLSSLNCDDNNPCTTDACDTNGGCLYTNNSEPCSDGSFCTENDYCLQGNCHPGTPRNCNDNNPCTDDYCNPEVGCLNVPNTSPCNDQDPCTAVDVCSAAQCVGTGSVVCDDSNVCTTDTCIPKVGCSYTNNTNPCDDKNACTLNDQCSGGSCVPGVSLQCNDGNECTSDACIPSSGCQYVPLSGTLCSDNNACTIADKCQAGVCAPGPQDPCDDNEACTLDSCEPATGCKHTNISGSCNDGNFCTVGDTCQAGKCVSGTQPLNCDDGNECTQDSCATATGCVNAKLTGTSCDDLNACTEGDLCSAGVCVAGFARNCSDSNVCTDDKCHVVSGCYYEANTAPCDDNDACTQNDICANKSCKPGSALVCNDNNVCTTDTCSKTTGCVYTKLSGTACDDLNQCTLNDTCSNGVCSPGATKECNDNNPCTADSCNAATGCVFTPVAGTCSDGNKCTDSDYCSAGQCISGAPLVCNDNNPCTDDSCSPSTGCVYTNDNTNTCTDNNVCTINDRCSSGSCINDGPLTCDDNNQCTQNKCDPVSGCYYPNQSNGYNCNDNNKCTTVDTCQNGQCIGSSTLTCVDGNPCTQDNCDPATGCVFPNEPNNKICNDNNPCTSGDHCMSGQCVKTADTVCPAQICKSSSCNSSSGCVYTSILPCCGNGIVETTGTAREECDDGCAKGDPALCDAADDGDGCDADCTVTCFFEAIQFMYCNGSCSYAGGSGCDQSDADLFCRLKTCNANASASTWSIVSINSTSNKPGIVCVGKGTNKGPQPAYNVNIDVWYSDSFYPTYSTGTTAIGNVTCNDP